MTCKTCELLTELLKAASVPDPVAKIVGKSVEPVERKVKQKVKRKASAYSKKYGKAFKQVSKKYKLKSGAWAKDGFKRAQKAAHKKAKRMK
jgi:hypothetical protein